MDNSHVIYLWVSAKVKKTNTEEFVGGRLYSKARS